MKEPRDFARSISQFTIPDGSGDRFSGYAVIGLPFSSGHVLALRRIEASSVGRRIPRCGTAIRTGRWTFHQNVPPPPKQGRPLEQRRSSGGKPILKPPGVWTMPRIEVGFNPAQTRFQPEQDEV
jgi:hypothetical protein